MHGVIGSTSLRRAARVTRAGGLIFVGTVLLMSLVTGSSAQSIDGELAIATLSARPEFVSGGDVLVRINRPWRLAIADLEASIWPEVHGLVLPKIESADHLGFLVEIIEELEAERGMAPGAAIAAIRSARPGSIETLHQERMIEDWVERR